MRPLSINNHGDLVMDTAQGNCFETPVYEALAHGRLSEDELTAVLSHVEGCDRCQQMVEGMAAHESLCQWMRAGCGSLDGPLQKTSDGFLNRLVKLGVSSSTSASQQTTGEWPERSPSASAAPFLECLAPAREADELGRLGPYRVLRLLGAGGMGIVFEAEDPKLKRRVALKAMRPALGTNRKAAARFRREAQATAAIKHDHIVTIYQVDEDRHVPFIAMEFLLGESLESRLAREGRLPLADVLRIGREIAAGLAAAHARGVIHRDIKPANIWLEPRVKILDFGLARVADAETLLTHDGAIVGTPSYMSPEQASGRKVDRRSDLFSLGCVLYRICTGRVPFEGPDAIELLMAVGTHDPPSPAILRADVPAALSHLILRLLEKSPDLRPASAEAVIESLAKIADRKDPSDQSEQADRTDRSRAAAPARQRVYRWAATAVLVAAIGVSAAWLVNGLTRRSLPNAGLPAAKPVPLRDPTAWTLEHSWGPLVDPIHCAAFSHDSQLVAVATGNTKHPDESPGLQPGRVHLWDMATGKELAPLTGHSAGVRCVAFSLDGRWLATGCGEINQPVAGELFVWHAATRARAFDLPGHAGGIAALGFTPDSRLLISVGNDQLVKFWDVERRQVVAELPGHQGVLCALAISTGGEWLATGGTDRQLKLWNIAERKCVATLVAPRETRDIHCLAFSPDGRTIVAGTGSDGRGTNASPEILVYDVATKQLRNRDKVLANYFDVSAVRFTPDGRFLLAADVVGRINLWDSATWDCLEPKLRWHGDRIWALAFSPDGHWIVSGGCWERSVKVWSVTEPRP